MRLWDSIHVGILLWHDFPVVWVSSGFRFLWDDFLVGCDMKVCTLITRGNRGTIFNMILTTLAPNDDWTLRLPQDILLVTTTSSNNPGARHRKPGQPLKILTSRLLAIGACSTMRTLMRSSEVPQIWFKIAFQILWHSSFYAGVHISIPRIVLSVLFDIALYECAGHFPFEALLFQICLCKQKWCSDVMEIL